MKISLLILFLFLAIPALNACSMGDIEEKVEIAKDFTLPDLDGNKVTLSEKRGKIVLLNFWATWCYPCRIEMPAMELLHKKFAGKDFEIIAVAMDSKGEKLVRPFVEENHLTFPILIDDKGEVSDLYQIHGIPVTYLIGRDGTIIDKVTGAKEWFSGEVQDYFEELIAEEKEKEK